jgi:hypothetical protein
MATTSTVDFSTLESFLHRVPSIVGPVGTGSDPAGLWSAKFAIDINHPLAWRVVQGFGHVLNYVSLSERLPTVFMPVSPPPYMNGGPREYLSWVIESKDDDSTPSNCATWLEGRLPRAVDDLSEWEVDDDPDRDQ